MRRAVGCVAAALLVCLVACVSPGPPSGYGIQAGHASFIPARTAILGCMPWPAGARIQSLPLTNVKPEVLATLCTKLDSFIVSAFNGQPYMKGFSPKFVAKALADAGQPAPAERLPTLWAHQDRDCGSCPDPAAFYRDTVAARPAWLAWLNQLSLATRNTDAVLLPFITFAYEKRYNDRGLIVAERAAGAVLLLVSTSSGQLIWASGREAVAPNKTFSGEPPPLPPWEAVQDHLFAEALWHDFPGRQVF